MNTQQTRSGGVRRGLSRLGWRSALCLLLLGCTEAETDDGTTPPACGAVKRFGNGATCSAKDPSLNACGTGSSRTCGSGWLCFDSPSAIDCTCTSDDDCTPRTNYINEARTAANKAPLASKCVRGRCDGTP